MSRDLTAFERVLFEFAKPRMVVLTTPNVEYNVKFENLPAGKFRHRDHRFEWTRAQFATWAKGVAERFGYGVRLLGVGPEDPARGGADADGGVFLGESAQMSGIIGHWHRRSSFLEYQLDILAEDESGRPALVVECKIE